MKNIENFKDMYCSLKKLNREMLWLVTVYKNILSAEVIGKSSKERPIQVVYLRVNQTMLKSIIFILCRTGVEPQVR